MTEVLRAEKVADLPAIRSVHEAAFDRSTEADLVDALRDGGRVELSLVAEQDGALVGHLLLSRIVIEAGEAQTECLGLAPMAVLPEHQRKGVGTRLVDRALSLIRDTPYPAVIVLGHPDYYPRFGFEPARGHGIECPYDAPDAAWMVLRLRGAPESLAGMARYPPEFDAV